MSVNFRNLFELLIAVALSTVILSYPYYDPEAIIIFGLIPSMCIILHEYAHKITAEKHGKVSVRIKACIPGIILGIVTAIKTNGSLIIMLPAHTTWEEEISPLEVLFDLSPERIVEERYRRNLRVESEIAVAGPAINGLISITILAILILIKVVYGSYEEYLAINVGSYLNFLLPIILLNLVWFNGLLAFINLVPLPIPTITFMPPFLAYTDGLILVMNSLELIREGYYRDIPWMKTVISIIGALTFILVALMGFVSSELYAAYEVITGEQ